MLAEQSELYEVPIIEDVPYSPINWIKLFMDEELVGYALLCTDRDLDFCIFDDIYEQFKSEIDEKIDEIRKKLDGMYSTDRIIGINRNGGITKIYQNFTDNI